MKLKNIVLGIAAIIMIAAIAIGITVAYLTDTAAVSNKMTIGPVDIELREYERVSVDTPNASEEAQVQKFNDNKPLLPAVLGEGFDYDTKGATVKWDVDKDGNPIKSGYTSAIWEPADVNNEVDKMVFVENVGKSPAYVRVFFAFEAGNYTSFTRFQDMIHINLNDTASEWKWEWNPALATSTNGGKYFIASATYQPILEPKQFTTISLSQIVLDPTATNDDVLAFGAKYEISVFVQGIQKVGFETAEEAVDEGFGDEIPFKDLTFETGVNLKTALHYLNGEESEDKKITADVSTVTFGLNKDYKNITSKYNPTFIGSEQDVAVYSYYVKNDAGKYDIYVLADSEIYTPKDSNGLFREMTSLTKVDTSNMDVSRTKSMRNMFRGSPALTDLNVSNWITSNVTDMYCMFFSCRAIDGLDVSKWNVSQVTDMSYMFDRCESISSLNLVGWDVGNVTTMKQMFFNCNSLTSLDLSDWDVSNVTTFQSFMSHSNSKLTSLNLSGWNVAKAENMTDMFYGCKALTSLDLNSWNFGKIDGNEIIGGNERTMLKMFYGCTNLETLEIGAWNVGGFAVFENMFGYCVALKNVDVKNWNVSNAKNMAYMFHNCYALTVLDLSGWETVNLTQATKMFVGANSLTTIYVGDGWNLSQIPETEIGTDQEKSSREMFSGCSSLAGGKGTTIAKIDATEGVEDVDVLNKTYARVDTEETPGYLTDIKDKPTNS